MKPRKPPVKANLIRVFLHHVDRGLIVVRDNSSGTIALQKMREALQAILNGVEPDEALGITRRAGAAEKSYSRTLAHLIHQWRKDKANTWEVVKRLADDWLRNAGQKPLSLQRLKNLYVEQLPAVEHDLSMADLYKLLDTKVR
jgi:hypothetical protein